MEMEAAVDAAEGAVMLNEFAIGIEAPGSHEKLQDVEPPAIGQKPPKKPRKDKAPKPAGVGLKSEA